MLGKVTGVGHRVVKDPKVIGAAGAFPFRILIFDGRFVRLDITVRRFLLFGGDEDDDAGFSSHAGPGAKGLAGEE